MISPATRLRKRDQRFYAVYPYPESDRVPHRDAELLRNSLCQKSWFLALDYEMTIDSFSGLIIPVMKRLSKASHIKPSEQQRKAHLSALLESGCSQ